MSDILVIVICAVTCEADNWSHIALFGESKKPWFKSFLDLPHGIPSHDTVGRVFAALNPEAFERAFLSWVESLASAGKGNRIAIKGKTLRRFFDLANNI